MLGMTLSSLASNLTVFNLAARPPSSLPSVSRARPIREARPCCESPAILLQFPRPGKGYLAAFGAPEGLSGRARTSLHNDGRDSPETTTSRLAPSSGRTTTGKPRASRPRPRRRARRLPAVDFTLHDAAHEGGHVDVGHALLAN